jgi:predicted AAA+ superfamily ATPase
MESPKGVLLLGPRQTGKSTLCRELKPQMTINLMNESTYLEFARNPRRLQELIAANKPISVFIDEIQRLPSLLNTIQGLVDETPNCPKFIMTGSSARKLRRGSANLLPGRLFTYRLGPLCSRELNYEVDSAAMCFGTLPEVYLLEKVSHKQKLLSSYTGTYLKEEIQAEALTKNIEGFARFLFAAAAEASRFLDLAKLAQQAQIDRSSAVRWFEILEDTLIVNRIGSFSKSSRQRLVQHPRFFFFDNGILNALLNNFLASPDRTGMLFENLFCSQVFASAAAADKEIMVYSYRTSQGAEVDFVIDTGSEIFAVECKATLNEPRFTNAGFDGLEKAAGRSIRRIVAYLGQESLERGKVTVLPWQRAIAEMGL